MDFKAQYNLYLNLIEDRIKSLFAIPDLPQKEVFEAMRYGICGGGKRIRPVLTMAAAELFGGSLRDAELIGTAVECIHNYSLIHDDMPCMDDDDLRRGRPTCHKAYGESTALLAGDGLLNFAFEILSREELCSMSAENIIRAIALLSGASGVYGMIGGQVIDLANEKRTDVTLGELLCMHKNKTGALIRAAALCGCICAGVGQEEEAFKSIDEFSSNLGLAFQIKDDILDVTGDEKVLGKPVGSDEKSGKTTFVTLLGLEKAGLYLDECTQKAKSALLPFGDKAWFLNQLADFLLCRDY